MDRGLSSIRGVSEDRRGRARLSFQFSSKWRAFAEEPGFLAATAVAAGLFFVFVVLPILSVFRRSFGRAGSFTLEYYADFFAFSYYYKALINSLILGSAVTAIVVVGALFYAVWVTSLRGRLSGLYRTLALLPLVAPPFIFSLSLIVLGGRRGLIARLFGLTGFSIYGWNGVILAQVIAFFPLAYMMIENVLRSVNPSLYEASSDLGASEWQTFRRVTLPLIAPGIVKASLLVFVMSLADFGNPMMVGGGLAFLATEAYLLVVGQYNMEMAAVLSVFLVLPSLFVFVLQNYVLKDNTYTTIGGEAGAVEERDLHWSLRLVAGVIATIVAAVIVVTFGTVFLTAFTKTIGVDYSFTLEHFRTQVGWGAFRNSLQVALAAALLSSTLGVFVSYLLVRRSVPGKAVLEFAGLFGFAVPGTVMGLGYVLAFNKPPLLFTGTLALLVLNMAFRNVAVGLEAGISKLHQIDVSLEEASADLGARPPTTLRRVVFPIMSSAFSVGFVYTFMTSMITVSSAIFLIAPGVNLAAIYILNLAEQAAIGRAAAMSVLLVGTVLVSLGVGKLITRRVEFYPGV